MYLLLLLLSAVNSQNITIPNSSNTAIESTAIVSTAIGTTSIVSTTLIGSTLISTTSAIQSSSLVPSIVSSTRTVVIPTTVTRTLSPNSSPLPITIQPQPTTIVSRPSITSASRVPPVVANIPSITESPVVLTTIQSETLLVTESDQPSTTMSFIRPSFTSSSRNNNTPTPISSSPEQGQAKTNDPTFLIVIIVFSTLFLIVLCYVVYRFLASRKTSKVGDSERPLSTLPPPPPEKENVDPFATPENEYYFNSKPAVVDFNSKPVVVAPLGPVNRIELYSPTLRSNTQLYDNPINDIRMASQFYTGSNVIPQPAVVIPPEPESQVEGKEEPILSGSTPSFHTAHSHISPSNSPAHSGSPESSPKRLSRQQTVNNLRSSIDESYFEKQALMALRSKTSSDIYSVDTQTFDAAFENHVVMGDAEDVDYRNTLPHYDSFYSNSVNLNNSHLSIISSVATSDVESINSSFGGETLHNYSHNLDTFEQNYNLKELSIPLTDTRPVPSPTRPSTETLVSAAVSIHSLSSSSEEDDDVEDDDDTPLSRLHQEAYKIQFKRPVLPKRVTDGTITPIPIRPLSRQSSNTIVPSPLKESVTAPDLDIYDGGFMKMLKRPVSRNDVVKRSDSFSKLRDRIVRPSSANN